MTRPKPGSVGVMTNDTSGQTRIFTLLDLPFHRGFAYFEPLNDPGATVSNPIKYFWPLLDQMP